tara:strand:+ start:921 stop:1298 length:378 start_codon:yes stop_codon:yes gene_type:complete
MVTFKNSNNSRRGRFRHNDRNFRRNSDNNKFKSDFSSISNFKRKTPGRNNHNASKLIEKYTDLAREALANEDKIMSENYFQHADHFTRILSEQEKNRANKVSNISEVSKNLETNQKEKQVISEKK